MDFELSGEQQQLRDSIRRYLAENYTFERYKQIKAGAAGWDREIWAGLADIGVLGIAVPADQDGLGFGAVETMVMMEECGRHLVLEPVLSSAVLATGLLAPHAADASVADLLSHMARGSAVSVLAHFETANYDRDRISTRAHRVDGEYRLEGHKAIVLHAPAADVLLVSARVEGDAVGLFRVPVDAGGLLLDAFTMFDGQRAANVDLNDVRLPVENRVGSGDAGAAIEAALDVGIAALCADAVGAMQAVVESTVQYVQTRQQFGQPIGGFQVIQHRIADMLIQLEQARSMSTLAALRCGQADCNERQRALSAAKVIVGQACRFVGQQAVQLHGGMGMTDELVVTHWFRRLTAADILFGDSDVHLARFIAVGSGAGAAG